MIRILRAVLAAALSVASGMGVAAGYPDRPIRLLVPQAPGSASDTVARIMAAELAPLLGQQVVVDNRPGGALTLGIELMVRATPDGYTIAYAPVGSLAIGPNMMPKPPYDVNRDIQAVAQVASNQMLLVVSPKLPFKSVQEVIDYAKANPGKLSNASSGNGSPGHVGMELFKVMTGTNIVHIPYKGGAAALTDLISGQVHLMLESQNSITPQARAGRVRGLAVSGAQRSTALPELPTIAEAGVAGYEATTWNGIIAPAGTPRAIVARLNAELVRALATDDMKRRFLELGADPVGSNPDQLAAYIRSELPKWAAVIRAAGIQSE